MASPKVTKFTVTFIFAIVLLLISFDQHVLATRPLDEEVQVPTLDKNLILQSLQRGPVPPSGGNPCTNTPGRSRGRCMLTEMNGHGGVAHPPPAFPEYVVSFGAASAARR
ncbi:hypothetical protein COLO4_15407 [Corchorus olitorius]|uniref:Uncharacterized protein n=1 Tax=Corchorus olitorius TaxID=93759 RepID=A0A1R3JN33_9ROSI|nr:hypothetical protein COLO4_15407 [Corchorus olitorius]